MHHLLIIKMVVSRFFPISRTVEVSAKPLNDIVFSQLKAKLSGKVQCILPQDCNGLKVILQSSVGGSDIIHSVVGMYKLQSDRKLKSTNLFVLSKSILPKV